MNIGEEPSTDRCGSNVKGLEAEHNLSYFFLLFDNCECLSDRTKTNP